ncbi:hemerythrin domain-containing protein [Actinoallomurus soli]|uniref:hemerythrin domain-containing protein n=1 Tax=Actinoallomurus soli TaxID=2952535 RepID=UPI0020929E8B|nr:hemerythrin domain-containing protein [Actinoallomurus soli]MCO5974342.1 hemerythrin domain-containing protein [Actinoallomurus soli]
MPSDRGSRDVIDVLTGDHRRVKEMFVRVIALPPGDRRRRYVVASVITELMRHAEAEEKYLYPAVRAHVPDGDRLAAEKIADHALTRQTINELDGLDPSDARFDEVFRRLIGATREHLADEETNLFPRLAGACDTDTLHDLGTKVERARRATPVWPSVEPADVPPLGGWYGPGPVDHRGPGLDGRPATGSGPRTW